MERKVMIASRLKWIITGLDWERLTPWEEKFVEDMENYFNRKGDLTDKQEEILERIYKEKSR
jgi:hypothetical protein